MPKQYFHNIIPEILPKFMLGEIIDKPKMPLSLTQQLQRSIQCTIEESLKDNAEKSTDLANILMRNYSR